jgi:hypothetical protein
VEGEGDEVACVGPRPCWKPRWTFDVCELLNSAFAHGPNSAHEGVFEDGVEEGETSGQFGLIGCIGLDGGGEWSDGDITNKLSESVGTEGHGEEVEGFNKIDTTDVEGESGRRS